MRDESGGEKIEKVLEKENKMATGAIILMAAMMGAMFLFGGHGKGHKNCKHASHEAAVSSSTAVSTSAVQNAPAVEETKDPAHTH